MLGDLSIQGNIKGLPISGEMMQPSLDNGARRVLVRTANKRQAPNSEVDLFPLASFQNHPMGAVQRAAGSR